MTIIVHIIQLLYILVDLALLAFGLMHASLNQLNQVNLRPLLTVKVSQEVCYEWLHNAIIFHQIWAENLLHLRQSQVEPPSDQLEKDEGQDEGEEEDYYGADELDTEESALSRSQQALFLMH